MYFYKVIIENSGVTEDSWNFTNGSTTGVKASNLCKRLKGKKNKKTEESWHRVKKKIDNYLLVMIDKTEKYTIMIAETKTCYKMVILNILLLLNW